VQQHGVRSRLWHGPQPLEALCNEATLGAQQEGLGDDHSVPYDKWVDPGQQAALRHVGKANAAQVVGASSITATEKV